MEKYAFSNVYVYVFFTFGTTINPTIPVLGPSLAEQSLLLCYI